MLRLVTVCHPAKAFNFYSGHPDVCTAIIIITEGDRKEKQAQRPGNRNTENVVYENRSDPCGCWCAWYSKEGDGRKHQERIRESYCDRDSKDLHAGICANPQKGA